MRTAVRLTGRRNIPVKAVELGLINGPTQRIIFAIRQRHNFRYFPARSLIKIRFFENKASETISLGTKAELSVPDKKIEATLKNRFSRPSCQLRVVETEQERKGLLLGSTPSWTIDSTDDASEERINTGILKFAIKSVKPCTWILECPQNDYPTIYLDKDIPNAKGWAYSNFMFLSLVLPTVIRDIFSRILETEEYSEVKWMLEWLSWQESIRPVLPGDSVPFHGSRQERKAWIDNIVEAFMQKHQIHSKFIGSLRRE